MTTSGAYDISSAASDSFQKVTKTSLPDTAAFWKKGRGIKDKESPVTQIRLQNMSKKAVHRALNYSPERVPAIQREVAAAYEDSHRFPTNIRNRGIQAENNQKLSISKRQKSVEAVTHRKEKIASDSQEIYQPTKPQAFINGKAAVDLYFGKPSTTASGTRPGGLVLESKNDPLKKSSVQQNINDPYKLSIPLSYMQGQNSYSNIYNGGEESSVRKTAKSQDSTAVNKTFTHTTHFESQSVNVSKRGANHLEQSKKTGIDKFVQQPQIMTQSDMKRSPMQGNEGKNEPSIISRLNHNSQNVKKLLGKSVEGRVAILTEHGHSASLNEDSLNFGQLNNEQLQVDNLDMGSSNVNFKYLQNMAQSTKTNFMKHRNKSQNQSRVKQKLMAESAQNHGADNGQRINIYSILNNNYKSEKECSSDHKGATNISINNFSKENALVQQMKSKNQLVGNFDVKQKTMPKFFQGVAKPGDKRNLKDYDATNIMSSMQSSMNQTATDLVKPIMMRGQVPGVLRDLKNQENQAVKQSGKNLFQAPSTHHELSRSGEGFKMNALAERADASNAKSMLPSKKDLRLGQASMDSTDENVFPSSHTQKSHENPAQIYRYSQKIRYQMGNQMHQKKLTSSLESPLELAQKQEQSSPNIKEGGLFAQIKDRNLKNINAFNKQSHNRSPHKNAIIINQPELGQNIGKPMAVQEFLKKAEIIGSYSNSFVAADLDKMRDGQDDKRACTANNQFGGQRKFNDIQKPTKSGLSGNNVIDLSKVVPNQNSLIQLNAQNNATMKTTSVMDHVNQTKASAQSQEGGRQMNYKRHDTDINVTTRLESDNNNAYPSIDQNSQRESMGTLLNKKKSEMQKKKGPGLRHFQKLTDRSRGNAARNSQRDIQESLKHLDTMKSDDENLNTVKMNQTTIEQDVNSSNEDRVSKPQERFSMRSSAGQTYTALSGLKVRKSALELKNKIAYEQIVERPTTINEPNSSNKKSTKEKYSRHASIEQPRISNDIPVINEVRHKTDVSIDQKQEHESEAKNRKEGFKSSPIQSRAKDNAVIVNAIELNNQKLTTRRTNDPMVATQNTQRKWVQQRGHSQQQNLPPRAPRPLDKAQPINDEGNHIEQKLKQIKDEQAPKRQTTTQEEICRMLGTPEKNTPGTDSRNMNSRKTLAHDKIIMAGNLDSVARQIFTNDTQKDQGAQNMLGNAINIFKQRESADLSQHDGKNNNAIFQNYEFSTPNCSNIDDYNVVAGKLLGRGAYAEVKECVRRKTGEKVAIKQYDRYKLLDLQRKKQAIREIKILSRLDHPSIIKLHESIDTPKYVYLIMEYARGESLHTSLKSMPDKQFSEEKAKKIIKQLLQALSYIHERHVAHRDIKLENIIIDQRDMIKLIDFGFCCSAPPEMRLKVFCGTPSYMAPEIVQKKEYMGSPTDIWASGILLYAMLCGRFPFKGKDTKELYKSIASGYFTFPDNVKVSQEAKLFIQKMLVVNPLARHSAQRLLLDPFIKNVIIKHEKSICSDAGFLSTNESSNIVSQTLAAGFNIGHVSGGFKKDANNTAGQSSSRKIVWGQSPDRFMINISGSSGERMNIVSNPNGDMAEIRRPTTQGINLNTMCNKRETLGQLKAGNLMVKQRRFQSKNNESIGGNEQNDKSIREKIQLEKINKPSMQQSQQPK